METSAISVTQLSKVYREGWIFRKQFQALSDVSFDVRRGEIFGLLGPNGAGKTTFLKILLGIIRKSGGQARMMGYPAGSRAGRQQVGYLPEHLRIPVHMTGYTALECYGGLSDVPRREIRSKRGPLLDRVGLGARGADRVKKYSKGMLQRLGLAQALLHDPQLLVLDEPTDGLDPRARAEMRQLIRELKSQGVTVFLNSHILQEVELICDRVAILHQGQLRYCGPVAEIGTFVSQWAGEGATGNELELRVSGEAPSVEQVLSGSPLNLEPVENGGGYLIKGRLGEQTEVDQLIDRLRAADISIQEVRQQQLTLEEAFLQIVARESETTERRES